MNYKAFVGFGMYGGVTAAQSANFMASWGIMGDIGEISGFWMAFILDGDDHMNIYL